MSVVVEGQVVPLLAHLSRWRAAHESKLTGAYLYSTRDGGYLFAAMMKEVAYDPALEDSLTELDIEVANSPEFDRLRMSVVAISRMFGDEAAGLVGEFNAVGQPVAVELP